MAKMRMLLLAFCLAIAMANAAVEISDFFPFGVSNGDTYLAQGDDTSSARQNISVTFPFFGYNHSSLWVNVNGAISFNSPIDNYTPTCKPVSHDFRMISPFWADVDTQMESPKPESAISFRESTTPTDLQKAKQDIEHAFPSEFSHINLTWAYIVTWNNVTFFHDVPTRQIRNTFQAIITTDGRHSFAIFYYNKIQWTSGRASGGHHEIGTGGKAAQVGFDAGDTEHREMLDFSCTDKVINISSISNVDKDGVFVFRIDSAQIVKPEVEKIRVMSQRAITPSICPPKSIKLRTNSSICYSFHPSLSQFVVAERECNSFGATLVSLKNKFTSVYIPQLANLFFKHLEVEQFWSNGHRLIEPSTFERQNGEDFQYTFWGNNDNNNDYGRKSGQSSVRQKRAPYAEDIDFTTQSQNRPAMVPHYQQQQVYDFDPEKSYQENEDEMNDCVAVNLEKGVWKAENCFDRLPFVCEFHVETAKEVPSTALSLEDFPEVTSHFSHPKMIRKVELLPNDAYEDNDYAA